MLTVIYFEWNHHSNVTYFAIAERNVFSVGIVTNCVTNLNSCFSTGMSSATVFSFLTLLVSGFQVCLDE